MHNGQESIRCGYFIWGEMQGSVDTWYQATVTVSTTEANGFGLPLFARPSRVCYFPGFPQRLGTPMARTLLRLSLKIVRPLL